MIWQQLAMAFMGFSAGLIATGGMIALLIGLGIEARYAAITHTADKMLLYEDMTMAGAVLGNIFQLFGFSLPLGQVGLGIYGLFAGIFLGGWILALAEMVNVFPIAVRRIKMKTGMPAVIISIAIAKALGSLVYFYKGF